MSNTNWSEIVASSLDGEEAHIKLENAAAKLPEELRGKRPPGAAHSAWEVLEHIRIAQWDLLEFCRNEKYEQTLKWPEDYWPKSPAPPDAKSWNDSVATIKKDRDALKALLVKMGDASTGKIPWGAGQTYLRTILLAVDHTAYHTGELMTVRRMLGVLPG